MKRQNASFISLWFCSNWLILSTILKYNSYELFNLTIYYEGWFWQFLPLSRSSKQSIQRAQKQSRKPSHENWIGRKQKSQGARVSLWGIIYWHVFRNGSWKGGPIPWRGLKPKGLEESLHRVSRSSRDHLGPHRFGVCPGLPTGLHGMERNGRLLQKALGWNLQGVLNSY